MCSIWIWGKSLLVEQTLPYIADKTISDGGGDEVRNSPLPKDERVRCYRWSPLFTLGKKKARLPGMTVSEERNTVVKTGSVMFSGKRGGVAGCVTDAEIGVRRDGDVATTKEWFRESSQCGGFGESVLFGSRKGFSKGTVGLVVVVVVVWREA